MRPATDRLVGLAFKSVYEWGQVLDKNKDWNIEMLPSGRTEDFINRTRWDDPEEALVFWKQYEARYATTITVKGQTYAMLDWDLIFREIGEAIG